MADVAGALEELRLHVFPTWLDENSLPIIQNIFTATRGDVLGIVRVQSGVVDTADTGVGHFLVVTGVTSTGEVATFDASNQEVGVIQYHGPERLPLLLVSTKAITAPSKWDHLAESFSIAMGSRTLTTVLVAIAVVSLGIFEISRRRRLAGGFLLGVCAVALVAVTGWHRVSDRDVASGLLTFDQKVYSLGAYQAGSQAAGVAVLVNGSQDTVEVKQLVASCGCMAVEFAPQTLVPSAKLAIPVSFSRVTHGLNRHWISVKTDAGEPRCELQFIGKPTMRVVPMSAMLGAVSLRNPQPLIHTLRFRDHVGQPEPVESVVVDSEKSPLAVALVEGGLADREAELKIYLVPTEYARPGISFTRFQISTSSNGENVKLAFDVGVEFQR